MGKVTISFTLDPDEDRDLIRWLESLPKRGRSRAIREALRAAQGGITLGDIYNTLKAIERKLAKVDLVANESSSDEPPEAAAALERLANLGGDPWALGYGSGKK